MDRRSFIASTIACGLATSAFAQRPSSGRYTGTLVLEALPDARLMRLHNVFGYIDADGLIWDVPVGAIVDGASIPRVFWPIIGSPFVGKYRSGSVIHDWFCSIRTRPWQATHRMFHQAMLTSGVDSLKARLMYLAVRYGGPSWDELTQRNSVLATGNGSKVAVLIRDIRSSNEARYFSVNSATSAGALPSLGKAFSTEELAMLASEGGIRIAPSLAAFAGSIGDLQDGQLAAPQTMPTPSKSVEELQGEFKLLAEQVERDGLDEVAIEALVERVGRVEDDARALSAAIEVKQ